MGKSNPLTSDFAHFFHGPGAGPFDGAGPAPHSGLAPEGRSAVGPEHEPGPWEVGWDWMELAEFHSLSIGKP